jgi:DNA-binding MarR family transcriptional regulator
MDNQPLAPADLAQIAKLDRVIHEPARLSILALLHIIDSADFTYVQRLIGLTRGNLSSHMSKLEAANYINVAKEFVDKVPRTLLSLTPQGRQAFQTYRQHMHQVLTQLPG